MPLVFVARNLFDIKLSVVVVQLTAISHSGLACAPISLRQSWLTCTNKTIWIKYQLLIMKNTCDALLFCGLMIDSRLHEWRHLCTWWLWLRDHTEYSQRRGRGERLTCDAVTSLSCPLQSRRCFHLRLDGETQKTVTFIAESEDKRDQWLEALRQFFDLKVDDLKATYPLLWFGYCYLLLPWWWP